jgi:UDP-3-O-[3-hydroxymyristoyl] glucosamine N-acyltransferase
MKPSRGWYCVIGKNVKFGKNVVLGSFCEIRDNCVIGDNTRFGARCTLAAGTQIGSDCDLKYGFCATDTPRLGEKERKPCIIEDGVKAGARVTLMPGVIVHRNATIGAHSQVRSDIPENEKWWGNPAGPLGARVEDGAQIVEGKFIESKGDVEIHPTVKIQSFVSIKRGLYKNTSTRIGARTYICSFANIGHNVQIGEDCFIATGAKILGNVILGDHVYVGANAVIVQDKRIGTWVKVRAGEVVNQHIADDTYYGLNGHLRPNRYSPKVKVAQ